ncbi:MAG TPA: ATP-binding protein [Burkholderiales bacterium]
MSLRRRLLLALLGAVLACGLLASAATYYAARSEVQALLDEELRQVALSLRDHALLDLRPLGSPAGEHGRRVVVQIWDRHGFASYLSNATTPLPLTLTPGFSTLPHEGREWRMFTLRAGAQVIQAAQPTAERTQRAAAAALRVLVPVLGALPLLTVLVWLILDRGFAPLSRLASAVGARSAPALEPLPAERVPEEVAPLVGALNNLLARLREAFDVQRRFAADAAHELRTPLTALKLQIQLLERARGGDERATAIAGLKERAQRAERIVQQLLAMARLEPEAVEHAPQRVALDEVARAVVRELSPLATQKGVRLHLARAQPAGVRGAEEALRLLATNLVDNAIRYTPAGGEVQVSTTGAEGLAILQVSDDGPGIPAAERERVFDRFYRGAAAPEGGSGLGLAIVRRVAQLHGARVELAEGLQGRGLTTRLVAPAADQATP